MQRNLLLCCLLCLIAVASCKEKAVVINTGNDDQVSDTTYQAPDTFSTQQRTILIEEFTGCSCPYCPEGHDIIYGANGIKTKYPERVAVIAYHIFNLKQAEPAQGHKYDFRTQDATDMFNTFFGAALTGLPAASFDRSQENNDYLLDRAKWPVKADQRAATHSPVNLYMESKYDSVSRNATVTVKAVYTAATAKKQAITLSIIENNIIDVQEKAGVGHSDFIPDYIHRSVLRDIITPFYGSVVLDSLATKTPGRVYQRTFKFKINDAWNANNCALVAFIHNNEPTDKEVMQAIEKPLR